MNQSCSQSFFAIHSLIHSFTRSLIHSFTHALVHSFTRSLVRSFIRSSVCLSSFYPFMISFVYSFFLVYSAIRLSVCWSIRSFFQSLTGPPPDLPPSRMDWFTHPCTIHCAFISSFVGRSCTFVRQSSRQPASQSVSHLPINALIHPFIHAHALIHSPIHSFIHSSIDSRIHSFIHSLIHPFIRSFIHSSIHSFIHSSVHSANDSSMSWVPWNHIGLSKSTSSFVDATHNLHFSLLLALTDIPVNWFLTAIVFSRNSAPAGPGIIWNLVDRHSCMDTRRAWLCSMWGFVDQKGFTCSPALEPIHGSKAGRNIRHGFGQEQCCSLWNGQGWRWVSPNQLAFRNPQAVFAGRPHMQNP